MEAAASLTVATVSKSTHGHNKFSLFVQPTSQQLVSKLIKYVWCHMLEPAVKTVDELYAEQILATDS